MMTERFIVLQNIYDIDWAEFKVTLACYNLARSS